MAKKFIDKVIPKKDWRKISSDMKVVWLYLWMESDSAGVWSIDEEQFEFDNGFEFEIEMIKEVFAEFLEFSPDKILIKDLIRINFVELKKGYNPHKPVFRSIESNNLKLNSSLNQASFKLVDEEEDEEEDEDKKGGMGENNLAEEKNIQIKTEFLDNPIWIESQAKAHKRDVAEIVKFLNTFWQEKYAGNMIECSTKQMKDMRIHFSNWMKIQNKTKNDGDNTKKNRLEKFLSSAEKYGDS